MAARRTLYAAEISASLMTEVLDLFESWFTRCILAHPATTRSAQAGGLRADALYPVFCNPAETPETDSSRRCSQSEPAASGESERSTRNARS